MKLGSDKKLTNEYVCNGTCSIFAFMEPLGEFIKRVSISAGQPQTGQWKCTGVVRGERKSPLFNYDSIQREGGSNKSAASIFLLGAYFCTVRKKMLVQKWRILQMDVDKIDLINNYLEDQMWMDFELCSVNGDKIEMFGYLDEADDDKIKIVFQQPYMMLCTIFFVYEGEGDIISLVKGDQLTQLYKKYSVTEGNQIFRISNTDIGGDMYIIAKGIEVQIMDEIR